MDENNKVGEGAGNAGGTGTTVGTVVASTGGSVDIPAHVPPASTSDAQLLSTIVPEEFKDRPYLKDILSFKADKDGFNALFKKLDGAEKLIGKKSGIPEANAPKEEWDKFYSLLRPATADEYELKAEDGKQLDAEFSKKIKSMFHAAGLTKTQAALIQEQFNSIASGLTEKQRQESEKLDAEFDALSKNIFGADSGKSIEVAKNMIADIVPANVKPLMDKMNNESLVILTAVMNAVHKKYVSEDGSFLSGGDKSSPVSKQELQEEGRRLLASAEYMDEFHPNHADVAKRIKDIYARVGKM